MLPRTSSLGRVPFRRIACRFQVADDAAAIGYRKRISVRSYAAEYFMSMPIHFADSDFCHLNSWIHGFTLSDMASLALQPPARQPQEHILEVGAAVDEAIRSELERRRVETVVAANEDVHDVLHLLDEEIVSSLQALH